MNLVAEMPKKTSREKPPSNSGGKKNVKVSVDFHRKLKTVASAHGLEIGELVEREMEEFLRRETAGLPQTVEGSSPDE